MAASPPSLVITKDIPSRYAVPKNTAEWCSDTTVPQTHVAFSQVGPSPLGGCHALFSTLPKWVEQSSPVSIQKQH